MVKKKKSEEHESKLKKIEESIEKFKSVQQGRVKFAEVDSFGVVHNLQFLYWIEWARTEYFRSIGVQIDHGTFVNDYPFMVAHAEIDYFAPAKFNDEYEVLTRVSYVKKSSMGFENIVRLKDGTILASAEATMVHYNVNNNEPERVNDYLRTLLRIFEGDNIEL